MLLTLELLGNDTIKSRSGRCQPKPCRLAWSTVGVAAINTIAHLGTGSATSVLGYIENQTGSFQMALIPLAKLTLIDSVTMLLIGR